MSTDKFTYTHPDEFEITPPESKQERSLSDYDGEPEVTNDKDDAR